jgi:hypothetical protein
MNSETNEHPMKSFFDSRRLTGRFFYLLVAFLAAFGTARAIPPITTTVADIVYRADGSSASGTLLINWPQFNTSDGKAVAAGTMNVTIGAGGAVSIPLAPNVGASPAGTFYRVTYKLDDGTSSTEFWSVPATSPTTISAIRSTVVPASMAVQVVSRNYVDSGLALKAADTAVVHKSGDTMSGPLTLSADPVSANQAATKNYVDANGGTAIAQKLSRTGDTPTDLAGARYATQFANIQAAITAAGTNGSVVIPSDYVGSDSYTNPNHVPVVDMRNNTFQVNNLGGVRIANAFSGADLGAQINAADADLGASPGQIWAYGGGAITTQIIVSQKHVLRLFAGTYTNALGARVPAIRLDNNSSLIGEGSQAIVQESSNAANTSPVIVCAFALGTTCASLAGSTSNIHVSGVHFQGANPNVGTSLIDSVSLGNCKQCSVTDNWFESIASSHVLIGGTSGSGNWADGFEVSGNYFSGSANCSVCVINGQNISVHDNYWTAPGNGSAAQIDVEPNSTTDHAQNIDLHDNLFDNTAALNSVYCVTIQNGPFVAMGQIKIHDNLCFGGAFASFGNAGPTGQFKLISCFNSGPGGVNSMSDIEIYDNVCRVTVSAGIVMVGTNRGSIRDNMVECAGADAITLAGSVTNSVVERNRVLTVTSPSSCGQNPKGAYLASIISETNSGNANNIFRDNLATATVINGSGSKQVSSDLADGSGRSFHVPVGLNGGASGGIQLVPVTTPTLSITTGASGSCVLSSGAYFWKVRAVTAGGGMGVPSNEVTQNAGGGFGCPIILWTKVAGAKSYNLYRSTTTGTEQLIANIADGSVRYDDLGGQTPSTSIDGNDSSVSISGAESTAPAGIAGSDILWPDRSSQCWKMNNNNAAAGCIPTLGSAQTWTATQTFSSVASLASASANPASAGLIRLSQGDTVKFRNNANTADLSALSESGDVLQLGEATNGINVPGPANFANLTASGTVTAAAISTGGDSFANTPRMTWGAFLPGALSSLWTASQFTLKKAINVVQIDLRARTAPAGCTTFPVVQITDGTTAINTTLNSAGVTQSVTGGQNYAANATLLVKVSTAGAGCTTNASDVNVTVQYKMQ